MSNGQLPPLNFNDITKIYRTEQGSTEISEIRKDFYPSLREYIEGMKKESEEEIRRDPYSSKASSKANEIKKVTQKGNQIFQFRQKKVMLMALRESNGGKVDVSRLTDEEKHFFDDMTDRLKAVKVRGDGGSGLRPLCGPRRTIRSAVWWRRWKRNRSPGGMPRASRPRAVRRRV